MAVFQPIAFRIGNEHYGMDISKVSAIENHLDVVRIPNSSPNIKGIINLRGEIIPVVDLKAKFGLLASATLSSRFIIVNLDNMRVAIEVDEVEEIHSVEEDSLVEMPSIATNSNCNYFYKVVKEDKMLILLIDPNKLLSQEEQEIAEKLAKEE